MAETRPSSQGRWSRWALGDPLRAQRLLSVLALALLAGLALHQLRTLDWRAGALFAVGAALGAVLHASAFGFAGAYRAFFRHRDASGLYPQLLLLALGSLVFVPVLALGQLAGTPLHGALAPVGTSVAVGALLFGIGMQLGDGCASGTLYTVGGGSRTMVFTLLGFMAGSVFASLHMAFWWQLPELGVVALNAHLGWVGALLVQLGVLTALWLGLNRVARDRGAAAYAAGSRAWPLWLGAVGLVTLNLATLVLAGHPWTIAWGYTLWGGKLATALGVELHHSAFWAPGGYPAAALGASLLADTTSAMNLAVILGATAAAALQCRFGRFAPLRPGAVLAATLGGVLMGYGARLAYGCNIGALFSGVVSLSLHGWLWLAAALAGCWIGLRLRPWFGLD